MVGEGLGAGGRRYSKVWERIMFRSCIHVVVRELNGYRFGRGELKGLGKLGDWGRTESVHLKFPRNMRASDVVTRRDLLSKEER